MHIKKNCAMKCVLHVYKIHGTDIDNHISHIMSHAPDPHGTEMGWQSTTQQ